MCAPAALWTLCMAVTIPVAVTTLSELFALTVNGTAPSVTKLGRFGYAGNGASVCRITM